MVRHQGWATGTCMLGHQGWVDRNLHAGASGLEGSRRTGAPGRGVCGHGWAQGSLSGGTTLGWKGTGTLGCHTWHEGASVIGCRGGPEENRGARQCFSAALAAGCSRMWGGAKAPPRAERPGKEEKDRREGLRAGGYPDCDASPSPHRDACDATINQAGRARGRTRKRAEGRRAQSPGTRTG